MSAWTDSALSQPMSRVTVSRWRSPPIGARTGAWAKAALVSMKPMTMVPAVVPEYRDQRRHP